MGTGKKPKKNSWQSLDTAGFHPEIKETIERATGHGRLALKAIKNKKTQNPDQSKYKKSRYFDTNKRYLHGKIN